MMILKEIRREVEDKKGNKHVKLISIIKIEEDSLIISIKHNDWKEAILVDINSIIGPYVDKGTIDQIRARCKSIYSQNMQGEKKVS